jgi:hypothetical protein
LEKSIKWKINEEIDRKVEKWKSCHAMKVFIDWDFDSGIEPNQKWMNQLYCYRYNRISFDTKKII